MTNNIKIKGCTDECSRHSACDFCRLFNYNGDKDGTYLGLGYCVFHERPTDPGSYCEDFICTKYKVIKK
jgi:hypothetical protein